VEYAAPAQTRRPHRASAPGDRFPPRCRERVASLVWIITPLLYRTDRLFITSRKFDRLMAPLPREVQGFRFPAHGAADDDPPPGFQQTQAVADIAFGRGERAHQLGVATRDHPTCALLIPQQP